VGGTVGRPSVRRATPNDEADVGDDNLPEHPDDPFGHLPPELRAMFEQLGGAEGFAAMQEQLGSMMSAMGGIGFGMTPGGASGPVDWDLASRVALQVAAEGDRSPTAEEVQRATEALQLAEHWLDGTTLPAPPDAGALVVGSRQEWVNAAITALRPLIEPVAEAAADALVELADQQLGQLGEEGANLEELERMGLPPEIGQLVSNLLGGDLGQMLRPASAAMTGIQTGQVVGKLSQQLLGQYELGIPTAPRSQAHHLAVNVAEVFDGYDLDATEVAIVIALTEGAHRRLYHAIPWLEDHVRSLVARFAAGTEVDPERLQRMMEETMLGVDHDDPDQLREAMQQAAQLKLEPTEAQRRVLERLQGVVCLVGAWARHEVARAVEGRLPSLGRIEEVLRRRRATRGDGEELLSGLLGLDLKPEDEAVGERFVEAVEAALGPQGLHRALAHPENLPDADELADPSRWVARMGDDVEVPDDASALFGELEEAPIEGSAAERTAALRGGTEDPETSDDYGHESGEIPIEDPPGPGASGEGDDGPEASDEGEDDPDGDGRV
jgi:putative hydrolase